MDARNRKYFVVNFHWSSHNMRVGIIKQIPTVKIRRDTYYSGMNQMMIGCHNDYCDALLFELRKAKRNDGYCTCFELGHTIPIDRLNDVNQMKGETKNVN